MNSEEYYNRIAIDYQSISNRRKKYIESIDSLILQHLQSSIYNYMDVGTGDGMRALKLAKALGVKELQLVDNSEIINLVNLNSDGLQIDKCLSAVDKLKLNRRFDLITCLWNVLGHVGEREDRLKTLKTLKEHLSANGTIILDVNNRYNISEYGFNAVQSNLSNDFKKYERAGYFELKYDNYITEVYIHSPFEMNEICKSVGLKVEVEIYINYSTGNIESSIFEGQLLYIIKHLGHVK